MQADPGVPELWRCDTSGVQPDAGNESAAQSPLEGLFWGRWEPGWTRFRARIQVITCMPQGCSVIQEQTHLTPSEWPGLLNWANFLTPCLTGSACPEAPVGPGRVLSALPWGAACRGLGAGDEMGLSECPAAWRFAGRAGSAAAEGAGAAVPLPCVGPLAT